MAVTNPLRRSKLRFVVYFLAVVSACGWLYSYLYIRSAEEIFGGVDKADALREGLRVASAEQLKSLEKKGASADTLYEKRLNVALLYQEHKDYKLGRKILLKEKEDLLKLPESEETMTRLIKVEEMIAHIDMDEGLFVDARERVARSIGLADELVDRYQSQNGQLLHLSMVNETGIIAYLEANTAPDMKVRKESFARSRGIFEELIARIDSMQHDGSKWTAACQATLSDIKNHAMANLNQVKEDQKYESMFQQT
ncbi:MAG: hypothetical protein KGS72_26195 [Cyanobacteria bacterium REEB67]|nr:hypothetical protein [Cyanobacteria bacterium REEB67]